MVNWYSKGQSQYTEGNFHMAYYIDMDGYDKDNYDSQDIEGDGESGDPFMAFAIDTQTWAYGSQQVEIGLLGSYRIKIDNAGIWGLDTPFGADDWVDLLAEGGGGAENLGELLDVVITDVADNELLAWDVGSSKWINQTAAEAGLVVPGDLHAEAHNIASHNDTTATGAELETLTDGSDASTLHLHTFDTIANPSGTTEINFANKHLHFTWVAPASEAHHGAFEIEASGAFSGDLIHIHQHTGNVGAGTYMVYIECEDDDASCLHLKHGASEFDFGDGGLKLGAGARISIFDTGALDASDTKAPTNNTVKEYADTKCTTVEAVQAVEDTGLVLSSAKVITSADEDLVFNFGRMKVGPLWANAMCISHTSKYATGTYALRQLTGGETSLNAPTGQNIVFRNNGATKATVSGTALTMYVPIAMGTNKITGLGNGVNAQDAMAYGQKYTGEEAHAFIEANALFLTEDLTITDNNIIMAGGGLVDGKDVSDLCTAVEAVQAVAAADAFINNDESDVIDGDFTCDNLICAGLVDNVDISAHHANNIANVKHLTDAQLSDLHAAFTAANARAALGDIIGSDGHLDGDLDADGFGLIDCDRVGFRASTNSAIQMYLSATDHRYHGTTFNITTNGGSFGVPMYMDTTSRRVSVCVDTSINTMPCIGIYVAANWILIEGYIRDNTWNFAFGTANKRVVYVNASVCSTTIPPTVGDIVQVIGVPISADEFYFKPSLDWVVRQ